MVLEDRSHLPGDQIATEAETHGVGFQVKKKMQVNESLESLDFLHVEGSEWDYAFGHNHMEMGVKPHAEATPSSHTTTPTIKGLGFDMSRLTSSQLLQSSLIQKNRCITKLSGTVRYAFRTRSETDVLEDGYKWRKYGRKSVRKNPNPRHYYRCADRDCDVKKTLERDPQDNGVVITTYDGKHNHEIPSLVYYIRKRPVFSQQLSLDQYHPHPFPANTQADFMSPNNY